MAKNLAAHPAPNIKFGSDPRLHPDTKIAANPSSDHSCWLIVFEDVKNISKREKIESYSFEAFVTHQQYLAKPQRGNFVTWILSPFVWEDEAWEKHVMVRSEPFIRQNENTTTPYAIWSVDNVPAGSSLRILLGINHRIETKQADDAFEFQDGALSINSAKFSVNAQHRFQDASGSRFEIEIKKVVGSPESAIANEIKERKFDQTGHPYKVHRSSIEVVLPSPVPV
ncbi:hypothetical protein BD410DRAFT_784123 [Rickenella mellea]|uniref:Uncharacterized protein n=1 Tax=Rickenella mellea TaxID=50990 RepID=A0A4Y7QGV6_9AGAM|nr:hypothetical protein BD410DRAFT_784123 [Rickenella mellea]